MRKREKEKRVVIERNREKRVRRREKEKRGVRETEKSV